MKYINIKALHFGLKQHGGRSYGLITSPNRGALIKKNYRFLDTKRRLFPQIPATIIYPYLKDPNRTAYISLIMFPNGILTYIIATQYSENQTKIYNLKSPSQQNNKGWSNFLSNFSLGSIINNIEIRSGIGAQFARSAGTSAIILRKDHNFKIKQATLIKLKSGAHHLIKQNAVAISGITSNHNAFLKNYKKAGVIRLLGKKPRTRPSAMNPVDHPMGGRTKGGCQPQSKNTMIAHIKTSNIRRHNNEVITARQNRLKKKY